MDPNQQQLLLTGGAKDSTYVDDVFHIQVHTGTSATRIINNGIDLAGEGGLIWAKSRTNAWNHTLFDTVRGTTNYLRSNSSDGNTAYTGNGIISYNNNGYTLGDDQAWSGLNNASQGKYLQTTFRKAPGFFDVVTYTGNGVRGRQIAHSLKCKPGLILIKFLGGSQDWCVYHRSQGATKYANLNNANAFGTATVTRFNDTEPTATHFTVGEDNEVNGSGDYIAYLFAGGPSTAATARSVDLDGDQDALLTSASSDYNFGTGDFTVEHWIYPRDLSYVQQTLDTRTASYNNNTQWCTYIQSDGTYRFWMAGTDRIVSDYSLVRNQWHHIAISRNSGKTRMYINGVQQTQWWSDSTNYTSDKMTFGGHGPDPSNYSVNALYSQVRVVKGQALYTTSFIPPKEPLTTTSQGATASNVKLLCCNSSSVTGATVGTVTAYTAGGNANPTATTVNPFDDPEGFQFGEEGDQNIVKCGTYKGNGTANSLFIDCGWEPQWLLIKKADEAENWLMLDCMRGIANRGGNVGDKYITANQLNAEADYDFISLTPTGFKLTVVEGHTNTANKNYVYVAIRRPDGYAGKPAEAGTDVFAMDGTSNGTNVFPQFTSGFAVDFSLTRNPTSGGTWDSWHTGARLLRTMYQLMATNNQWSAGGNFLYDYNDGIFIGNWGNYMSWMWKRHAGFDVVVTGPGKGTGQNIRHSLGKVPEMIWTKKKDTSNWPGNSNDNYVLDNWFVWHKDYHAEDAVGYLNTDGGGGLGVVNNLVGGANSVSVGFHSNITYTNDENIMMFFASIDGICKVGSYTGANSQQTITTGFQPRFVIIKSTSASRNWVMLDTVRGWAAGNDQELNINKIDAQGNSYDFGAPTATGFTVNYFGGSDDVNVSGKSYIYYAHA